MKALRTGMVENMVVGMRIETHPSAARLRSLASILACHHFQSVASLLNLLPDVVVMSVESCLISKSSEINDSACLNVQSQKQQS